MTMARSRQECEVVEPAHLKIGVMVSGRGVALEMALRACKEDRRIGAVVAVAANRPCGALEVARRSGVPNVGLFDHADHHSRYQRDVAVTRFLETSGVNFVYTAGYSDVVDSVLIDAFPERVMSIFPSLLPAYETEVDTIGAPIAHGVKLIGVSFHLRRALSGAGGPIIAQRAIPIDIDDTVETVEPRVARAEEEMLPGVLLAFAQRRVSVENGRVRIADSTGSRL